MAKTYLARVTPRYLTGYTEGQQFRRLDCITHDGSTWMCLQDTTLMPSLTRPSADWMLVARKGEVDITNLTESDLRQMAERITGLYPMVVLTEEEFAAIETPDPDTMYFRYEE